MTEEVAIAGCRTSDSDLYAALMLSDLLENKKQVEQQIPKAPDTPPNEEEQNEEDFSNVIWVPADKHPQIAPTEFAKFIQGQGTSIPIRRTSSLHRQKSILSQSTTSQEEQEPKDEDDDDDQDLNRTLSEKKRAFLKRISVENERLALDSKTHVFDRNSTAYDDSRIIAPRTDRSLLRRSAFSARGRGRKSNVESVDHESKKPKRRSRRRETVEPVEPVEPTEPLIQTDKDEVKSVPWNKSEGVILYDQPVNMSEWIDLGSASLESDDSQRGILSRVHDAESQLRSQISQEEGKQDQDNEKDNHDAKEKDIKTISNDDDDDRSNIPPPLPSQQASVVAQDGPKRPTIKRTSETPAVVIAHKQEKRSSWLASFFQDKKNANNNNNNNSGKKSPSSSSAASSTSSPTATAIQITSNNGSSSPLSTLATLFTRSLSLKSNTSSNLSTSSSLHSTVTSATIEEPQGKKKRSSRLEIPPPSQRTFFNTNRLPLHVERAIYRLSHIKLANPKRPLSQQVLISNLMFWYLSIQQNDHQIQQQQMLANEHGLTLETIAPSTLAPKKMGNSKMSRLIHSAKKKKGEVAQLVNPPIKSPKQNVQFNLPSIPTHHQSIEDEEDNVPLSHFKN